MVSSTYSIITRRGSGVEVNHDAKLHNGPLEPYDHAVAGDNVAHDLSVVDRHKNTNTLKRVPSGANLREPKPSEQPANKGKVSSNSIKNGDKHLPRVLCWLYMKDPSKHAQKVSCYNKGFAEMSRLKRHLVKEHKVP